jgi:ketosteroid isomerase-like protein
VTVSGSRAGGVVQPAHPIRSSRHRRPAQVGKFFEGIGANWDSLVLDIGSVTDVGPSQVVGVLRANGMQKDGTARQYGAAHVFDVNNGKITRFREYVDL